jgi:2-methylisocitrate lyase-like PEP mutase family enzyme
VVGRRTGERLRERLAHGPIVVAPGAYDALLARLIEAAGFEAVYFTGAGASYSILGQPDLGLLTLSEMAERAARLSEAVRVPVIADGDTGYGNAINVIRTVREYERAGVAAIQLEDQASPKRCGHLSGKELISADEMVGKLRAARDARSSPDLLIVARTDARSVLGLDEALRRAERYAEAGADVLFVEAPQDTAQQEALGRAFAGKVPLLANMVEGGRTPLRSAAELGRIGFKLVIYPGAMMRVTAFAAAEYLKVLKADGATARLKDRMFDFSQLNAILGLADIMATGAQYDAGLKSAAE